MEPLANLKSLEQVKYLSIKLASPDEIRKWSRGEVTKPETINYRTLKPEKDGLFDERIFGPTKDWECYCGKYKRIRYKGVICDKCGVEVTLSRVRRERMGHISLACPVVHIWFFRGGSSIISLVLDISPKALEQVIYFVRYLVLEVREEKRKEAVKNLESSFKERMIQIRSYYKTRRESLEKEKEEQKDKAREKIKDKDRLGVALNEIEVDYRKKLVLLKEEEKKTLEKTGELFDRLSLVVRNLRKFSVLTEDEYDQLLENNAASFFDVKMGAEAISEALASINIDKEAASLREEIKTLKASSPRFAKVAKRLRIIDGMRRAKVDPLWTVLKVVPVIPPDLRPMVQLSGGRFATSDLNDLYRRVINRNNRLKHLITLGAPEIILRNEKRMLQEAVDALIDSSQRKATRRGRGRQPLRSLTDMLRGKQGRFRQNLLGKRVDYSGRSVIVVGPELKLNQCGLPKEMALEMFKPFVLREMILRGIAPNVKSAKNMLERRPSEVFDILEEITKDHPVLLNRAPTLHKLSFQAFYPVLVEGSAIRIHPAVCPGYNADFDGDQMAVHVPLSKEAIKEAKELMLPEHNLLKPADGSPVATPAHKEMALGVYYFTSVDEDIKPCSTIFADQGEAILAYQTGKIDLRQQITVRINSELIETTVGRILFNEVLPDFVGFKNKSISSSDIKEIFSEVYARDKKKAVELIDAIKDIGFRAGTISGISFGVFDTKILPEKEKYIKEAERKVAMHNENYQQGLITKEEKEFLLKEVWTEVTEILADKTWEFQDKSSPVRLFGEARVGRISRDQIKQLSAMRGLVVDPLGKTVEFPIKSNFKEGLSVFEYITSARGSRKGLTDTALKTADAGYLTRRLIDVAHDVIVRENDCQTEEGFVISRKERPESFTKRIMGRFVVNDVLNPKTKRVIVKKGELIDESKAKEIEIEGIEEVEVRSPLTCRVKYGVCVKCYGWDLSNKEVVEIGTPVGIIAAQSIGEPGTQLTLRTKHMAGIVGIDVTQGLPRVEELFEARTPRVYSPLTEISGKVRVSESEEGWKVKVVSFQDKRKEEREYLVPKTLRLAVEDGQLIGAGCPLAHGPIDLKEILMLNGLKKAQEYLINQIQNVYESQFVSINDKHFEIIVRKMCDKVKVISSGDTPLLEGDIVDKVTFERENEKVLAAGGEPATASQVILGITKRALMTESWLSAASFEQTTDVLTEAAILGKKDRLIGMKENVIIGRPIPVTPERVQINF